MDKLKTPILIKDFITPDEAFFFHSYAKLNLRNNAGGLSMADDVVTNFDASHYADPATEILLVQKWKRMEEICGIKLLPTYSFYRMYVNGSELKKHRDRPSCEYSVTLHLGSDSVPWKMCADGKCFDLKPGEAIVYKGIDWEHYREGPYEGDQYSQVFMHYVNQEGPHKDWKYDIRLRIGLRR